MKRYARGKEAQMANAQIKIFLEEMSTKGKTRAVEELHERINAITQNYNLDLEKFLEIIYNGLDKLEINIRKTRYVIVKNPDDSYTTGKSLKFKSRVRKSRKSKVILSRKSARSRKSKLVRKSKARARKSRTRKSRARKSRARKSRTRKSRARKSKKIIDGRQDPRLNEEEDEEEEGTCRDYLKYLLDTAIEIIFSGRNHDTEYATNFEYAEVELQDRSLYNIKITHMDTQRFKMSVSQDGRIPYVSNYINHISGNRSLREYARYVRNQIF